MALIDEILARHDLAGPVTLLPAQGTATTAWATARHVVKIAHAEHRAQVLTETLVAPLASAAGVRTPALIAWAHEPSLAYSIWERVDGVLLDDRADDALAWRDVGRALGKLHAIAHVDDAHGLLRKRDKRDARPYLSSLPSDRAQLLAGWLDVCERAPPAPPRLCHYDVHGGNVILGRDGATLIDWADAALFDPACDFGTVPIAHAEAALAGYEEQATLGSGGEGRVLRAVIGQATRKAVRGDWHEPMTQLLAWLDGGDHGRFADWLPKR